MALRSGYKGIKKLAAGLKWNRPGILAADDIALAEVFFPRSEQAVLGAKNKLRNELVSTTAADITYTVTDGIVNVSALTANKVLTACMMYKKDLGNSENLILTGCPSGGGYGTFFLWWGIRNVANTDWIASGREEGTGVTLNLKGVDYSYVKVEIEIKVSQDYSLPVEFKPMLRLATDPDDTYVPYAMTNEQLTEKKVDKSGNILTSSNDLDDIKESGFYSWENSVPTNSPQNKDYSSMVVIATSNRVVQQVYNITSQGCMVYFRRYSADTGWGSWFSIVGTVVS